METLPECGAESVKPKAAPFRGWAGRKMAVDSLERTALEMRKMKKQVILSFAA
jgi:hypothetical protein